MERRSTNRKRQVIELCLNSIARGRAIGLLSTERADMLRDRLLDSVRDTADYVIADRGIVDSVLLELSMAARSI